MYQASPEANLSSGLILEISSVLSSADYIYLRFFLFEVLDLFPLSICNGICLYILYIYYLQRGSHVFIAVAVSLSVNRFYSKSTESISVKLCRGAWHDPKRNPFNFGTDPEKQASDLNDLPFVMVKAVSQFTG